MEVLDGNGGVDTLLGTTGNDLLTVSSINAGSIDTFGGSFVGISSLDGNGGTDTLRGTNANDSFSVTGLGTGSLSSFGGTFASLEWLDGNGGVDSLQGTSGNEIFTVTGSGRGTLNSFGGGFVDLDHLSGGGGDDTLRGTTANDSFLLTGSGSGLLDTFAGTFSAFNHLDGNGGADSLQGTLGNDLFSITAVGSGSVNTFGGSFEQFSQLDGGGGIDTLRGTVGSDAFTTSGVRSGSLNTFGGTFTTFHVLDGNGGSDTLEGTLGNDLFSISSIGAGTLDTFSGSFVAFEFLNGRNGNDTLLGTPGDDSFTISGPGAGSLDTFGGSFASMETIDGSTGVNILKGTAANDLFTVIGPNNGSLNTFAGTFTRINILDGNGGLDTVQGTISNDVFTTTGLGSGSLNTFAGTFVKMSLLDGNGGSNTLQGTSGNDLFTITGIGTGTLNTLGGSFSRMSLLDGNGGTDTLRGTGADDKFTLAFDGVANGAGSLDTFGGTFVRMPVLDGAGGSNITPSQATKNSLAGNTLDATNVGSSLQLIYLNSNTYTLTDTLNFRITAINFLQTSLPINGTLDTTKSNVGHYFTLVGGTLVTVNPAVTNVIRFQEGITLLPGGADTTQILIGNGTVGKAPKQQAASSKEGENLYYTLNVKLPNPQVGAFFDGDIAKPDLTLTIQANVRFLFLILAGRLPTNNELQFWLNFVSVDRARSFELERILQRTNLSSVIPGLNNDFFNYFFGASQVNPLNASDRKAIELSRQLGTLFAPAVFGSAPRNAAALASAARNAIAPSLKIVANNAGLYPSNQSLAVNWVTNILSRIPSIVQSVYGGSIVLESPDRLINVALSTLNSNGNWELALDRILNSPEVLRTAARIAIAQDPQQFSSLKKYLEPYDMLGTNQNGIVTFPGTAPVVFTTSSNEVPVLGDWNGAGKELPGVFNTTTGIWKLDTRGVYDAQGNPVYDTWLQFGIAGDKPIVGDWNGDGRDDVGVYRDGVWYLDSNGVFGWQSNDTVVRFGIAGDTPVAGDWEGTGRDRIGVFRTNGVWYLDYGAFGWQNTDPQLQFGMSGDLPVVGSWNGDGKDHIGVYRNNGNWYLDSNGVLGWQSSDTIYAMSIGSALPIINNSDVFHALVLSTDSFKSRATAPSSLTQLQLNSIVDQAIALWSQAGLSTGQINRLRRAEYRVGDLSGELLGAAWSNGVTIDVNGAGQGWFIDRTPGRNEEFTISADGSMIAKTEAALGVDVLTVVLHEMGHLLGLDDQDVRPSGIMYDQLKGGVRKLPTRREVDEVFSAH
jgi:hypothetical protein